MTHYTTKIEKPLSLDEARQNATQMANETGNPQPVYKIEEIETISPSYIKGRWYYGEGGSGKYLFTYIGRFSHYGDRINGVIHTVFNEVCFNDGDYSNDNHNQCYKTRNISEVKGLATHEQIEAHLIEAAIKIGFKDGMCIRTPRLKIRHTIRWNQGYKYDPDRDVLTIDCIPIYDGRGVSDKWATILSTDDNEEQQQAVKEDKNTSNPVLLSYRDENGTIVNIRATEVKTNPLEGE